MPRAVARAGGRLGARIRAGRAKAAAHGILDERAIARWMILDLAVGANFSDEPTVHRLLTMAAAPSPADRLGALVTAVLARSGEGR